MNNWRAAVLFASLLTLLSFTSTSFAASTTSTNATQMLLGSAFQYARCKTNFTVSYIRQVTAVVPKLSPLSQDFVIIQSDTATLSRLANAGNVTNFRVYLSSTFDPMLGAVAKSISAQIRAANLSSTTLDTLGLNYNTTLANYNLCSISSVKAYTLQKLSYFNQSINSYQEQSNNLESKGLDTSSLNQLLLNAQATVVSPLASAINAATNTSQTYAALSQYCLFDGCKNGTNFHLAAHFDLRALTAQLAYLQTNKNLAASSFTAAQAYLSNASSMLLTVGTKIYVDGQFTVIFDNVSAASRAMQQARQQASFAELKQAAQAVVANYQKMMSADQAKVNGLASKGLNTANLNATLSQAAIEIIAPLQAALNKSSNATQIYNALEGYCLENNCKNGTNYHLSAKLTLGEAQDYLAYTEMKASNSSYVIVNQSALAIAQGYLGSTSAVMGSVGKSQFTQGQTVQLSNYATNFTAAIVNAFKVSRTKLAVANTAAGARNASANATSAGTSLSGAGASTGTGYNQTAG